MTDGSGRGGADGGRTRATLVAGLLEHCAHLSVTGEEGPLADAVADRYARLGEAVQRVGDSVVVGAPDGERPLIALVGHLDVVPPTDADREPRVETRDGAEVVVGRGASDMKGGNVVAMSLFEDPALRDDSPYQVALVLYAGEEGPADGNELAGVLADVPWLAGADLAVILEPTDGQIQAGCLGGLHAHVAFTGRQAHSARPWDGENALTKAGAFLAELDALEPTPVRVDGVTFHDVWSATQAWSPGDSRGGGRDQYVRLGPRNAIPGTFVINLNLRFAPSRDLAAAERELRTMVDGRAAVEIVDRAPPARPGLDAAIMSRFVAAVGAEVAGKQAWTDVARFAELGVPAVNYGPGLTAQAHQQGEHVPTAALLDTHARLERFLRG